MKHLSLFGFLVALVFNGCAPKEVVIKTEYVHQSIPKPINKPNPREYNVMEVEFNDSTFYCLDPLNAKIQAVNWLMYKDWAEGNEVILKKLYEEYNTSK